MKKDMGLDFVRRTYEKWGADDPMYAVLTRHDRAGGAWDPAEFFRLGRDEVDGVMAELDGLGVRSETGRALDFGCGVGRLSQALAGHMNEVVGVDIAESMVEAARGHNRHGDRVRYVANTRPDLSQFDDGAFDFVYSSITLQHIPPRYVRADAGGRVVAVHEVGGRRRRNFRYVAERTRTMLRGEDTASA